MIPIANCQSNPICQFISKLIVSFQDLWLDIHCKSAWFVCNNYIDNIFRYWTKLHKGGNCKKRAGTINLTPALSEQIFSTLSFPKIPFPHLCNFTLHSAMSVTFPHIILALTLSVTILSRQDFCQNSAFNWQEICLFTQPVWRIHLNFFVSLMT